MPPRIELRWPPKVGEWYPIQLGNGDSKVIEVELTTDGSFSRVRVEFVAGCMPAPPEGRPDAPEDEWELPISRVWLTRTEWTAHAMRVPRADWPVWRPETEDDADDADDADDEHDEDDETCGQLIVVDESRVVVTHTDVLVLQLPEAFGDWETPLDVMFAALNATAFVFATSDAAPSADAPWLAFIADGIPQFRGLNVWLGLSRSVPLAIVDSIQRSLEALGAEVHRAFARADEQRLKPQLCMTESALEVLETGDWDVVDESFARRFCEWGDVVLRSAVADSEGYHL